jgi:hypothetical protein
MANKQVNPGQNPKDNPADKKNKKKFSFYWIYAVIAIILFATYFSPAILPKTLIGLK